MRAGPLVSKEKPARSCGRNNGRGVLTLQLDVTNLCAAGDLFRMQRRLSLFKRQRHQFVLVVENINQGAVRWRRRKKFLSGGGAQDEYNEPKENTMDVSSFHVDAACRSPVR